MDTQINKSEKDYLKKLKTILGIETLVVGAKKYENLMYYA